jgi:hypothetical protein
MKTENTIAKKNASGAGLRVKSNIKAGPVGLVLQHNQTVTKDNGLRIKSNIKAGPLVVQHNQTVAKNNALRIKSNVKAGGFRFNHNQSLNFAA